MENEIPMDGQGCLSLYGQRWERFPANWSCMTPGNSPPEDEYDPSVPEDEAIAGTIHTPSTIINTESLVMHESSRIDSFCLINAAGGCILDEETVIHVGSHVVGDDYLEMHPRSVVTYNCVLLTSTADLAYPASTMVPREERGSIKGGITLERESFVGSGAVIGPGVTLHEGAVAAANSYIDSDIPAWTIRFPDGTEHQRQRFESEA